MAKVYVSWDAVEDFVEMLDSFIRNEHPECTGIYGLPRGGLVFAVMLSHKLSLPLLMSPAPNCLIVDDICDSGESLIHYIKNSSSDDKPKYLTATMFYKANKLSIKPDLYAYLKQDHWVIFPFESTLENVRAAFPDEEITVIY